MLPRRFASNFASSRSRSRFRPVDFVRKFLVMIRTYDLDLDSYVRGLLLNHRGRLHISMYRVIGTTYFSWHLGTWYAGNPTAVVCSRELVTCGNGGALCFVFFVFSCFLVFSFLSFPFLLRFFFLLSSLLFYFLHPPFFSLFFFFLFIFILRRMGKDKALFLFSN